MSKPKTSREVVRQHLEQATDDDDRIYYERVLKMWDQYIQRIEADMARKERAG